MLIYNIKVADVRANIYKAQQLSVLGVSLTFVFFEISQIKGTIKLSTAYVFENEIAYHLGLEFYQSYIKRIQNKTYFKPFAC